MVSSYNLDHNILQLYNMLVQVRFTASKPTLDIQHIKLGIHVASGVAKRLKYESYYIRKY